MTDLTQNVKPRQQLSSFSVHDVHGVEVELLGECIELSLLDKHGKYTGMTIELFGADGQRPKIRLAGPDDDKVVSIRANSGFWQDVNRAINVRNQTLPGGNAA